MRDLTWTCHICGDDRPDRFISVYTVSYSVGGIPVKYNVRYCNDRAGCAYGAPAVADKWMEKISGKQEEHQDPA